MPRKKRRIRSPHPGVVLKERRLPSGATAWRARFKDPDSGREVYLTLDPTALPTHEARRVWAVRKSKELAKRNMDLEAGAPKLQTVELGEAINRYRTACKHRLRKNTLTVYETAATAFETWAKKAGIETTTALTPAALAGFREHLISRRIRQSVAGARRGAREESGSVKLSPSSVNINLRATKTMLGYLRAHGLLARLSKDAISDTLKALPLPRQQPEYLTPRQLAKLLGAAMRHDAAMFEETRNEHAGLRLAGTTPRYEPIAPFVAFLLLTGCRRGEALGLTWSDVDLDAVDHTGQRVGEIRLRAEDTKTHHARTIGLEVSPSLRRLLAGMKLRAQAGVELSVRVDALQVFGGESPYSVDLVDAARDRLVKKFGAPKFDWQLLRSTCATYLTNAPGIFGAATVFLSARQLGHSVAVAEKHYLGVHRGIPREARTLDAAMQIETQLRALLAANRDPNARVGADDLGAAAEA